MSAGKRPAILYERGEPLMNAAQFEQFVTEYEKLVYTICWQLVRDRELALDLSQETFLSAWRSIERCPAGYEKQWLGRIAANKARDHLRSAWSRKVTLSDDGSTPGTDRPDTSPDPEALFSSREGADELRQMVLSLREPYKTPCTLCLLQGKPPEKAARLCGRPPGTFSAQLSRGRKMLQKQILERRAHDETDG